MAHHKDAIKRNKQNAKRRVLNRHFRTKMRNQVKAVRDAVISGDKDVAAAQLKDAVAIIHRVVTKGVIHRNQAARRIARLNAAVKALHAA